MESIMQNNEKINKEVIDKIQVKWLKWRKKTRLFVCKVSIKFKY